MSASASAEAPSRLPGSRPVVVHVIDSLALGGTETFLVGLLPELKRRYDLILVTLRPDCAFPEERLAGVERVCLDYRGVGSLAAAALRLRRLIRSRRPQLVRAQLFLSGVVARLATPAEVPLIFSIHSRMSDDAYRKNRLAAPIEKLTYRRRHRLISVTSDALHDFDSWIGIKGEAVVLPNFIRSEYFQSARVREGGRPELRLVAVGMLKEVKNYFYLLEGLRKLNDAGVHLTIYGEGHLRGPLQLEIDKHRLNVALPGQRADIHAVLGDYDILVMPSLYEGFANAAVEAMAAGLPLIVSDAASFHEITRGNAIFVDPHDPQSFSDVLAAVRAGRYDLRVFSERGMAIAAGAYSKAEYLRRLDEIYDEALAERPLSRSS